MKKILIILLLLSGRLFAQTSTPPVTYLINFPDDTLRNYMTMQQVIDYVAAHGGGGSGWPSPQTSDVIIDAAGYAAAFENVGDYFVADYTGQTNIYLHSASDDAYLQFQVGGQNVFISDSTTPLTTVGFGSTNTTYDPIYDQITFNTANTIYTGMNGFGVKDGSGYIVASVTVGNGFITSSEDENTYAQVFTSPDGAQNYFALGNINGQFYLTLSHTGTTFNMALPSYANDAAAGVDGLKNGDLYQITGEGVVRVKQ